MNLPPIFINEIGEIKNSQEIFISSNEDEKQEEIIEEKED